MNPLAIDLFCGLGGWSDGMLAEGYDVIGFDIEQHVYGEHRYPGMLAIQDVTTLHGRQFRNAALIVASPPCQEYSYMAMPWSRAKAKAAAIRADATGKMLADLTRLFDSCFRIQREACEAAGHHIPMIVENVRGAIPWVGRSRWNFGSFHLWGDVPALMPMTVQGVKVPMPPGGDSLTIGFQQMAKLQMRAGQKVPGFRFDGSGKSFQSASVEHGRKNMPHPHGWFGDNYKGNPLREGSSKSPQRKFASAMIAKIPLPLSRHIAATFRPQIAQAAE